MHTFEVKVLMQGQSVSCMGELMLPFLQFQQYNHSIFYVIAVITRIKAHKQ